MSDEVDLTDEVFRALRQEYLSEAPARLDELRKDLAAACANEPEALASLRSRFHKLAGSGGSYGFQAITDASRAGEHWIIDNPDPDEEGFAFLGSVVGRIAAAFDDAARELDAASLTARTGHFGWRAHIAGESGELQSRLADTLRDARFAVTTGSIADVAGIPVSERPDLLVLVPGLEQDHPAVLAPWLETVSPHTLGVALVTDRPLDELLESGVAEVDLLVPSLRADAEVGRWARALGRTAVTPLAALIVLSEEAERLAVEQWLEAAGVLVTSVSSAAAGLGRIAEEPPDVVIVDWSLPERSAAALVRAMRANPTISLTPVLAFTTPDHDEVFTEMLAAGVDAPMVRPISPSRVVAETIHRARRSRRLEALLRRDALTGFLTRSALEDELESVLAHCQRSGEEVTFVLLDLDHFRRVNEQLGRRIGDEILLHVAQAIGRRIRASDFAIRMGGEEFGMLLRQCGSADAETLTNQLRQNLVERPPEVEGIHFPIRVSAGIASTASTGAIAGSDLLWEAEQALLDAKQTGRDKVVIAKKR